MDRISYVVSTAIAGFLVFQWLFYAKYLIGIIYFFFLFFPFFLYQNYFLSFGAVYIQSPKVQIIFLVQLAYIEQRHRLKWTFLHLSLLCLILFYNCNYFFLTHFLALNTGDTHNRVFFSFFPDITCIVLQLSGKHSSFKTLTLPHHEVLDAA